MNCYLKVLRHYADFSGRARRKEFWYFALFNIITAIVAMVIDIIAGWELTVNSNSVLPNYGPCYLTYVVATLLPGFAVVVRRLHDLGKNGWWILISLIPFVGGIWLIVLSCKDGQSGQNRYGANPKLVKQCFPERRRGKSIAIAFIVYAVLSLAIWANYALSVIQGDVIVDASIWIMVVEGALSDVLLLLFGVFYHPVGDSSKTANRQKIAFVLLAIATLILAVNVILNLYHGMSGWFFARGIVVLLIKLALLALALLLLLKSERKNIKLVSVLIIMFSMLRVVMELVMPFTMSNVSFNYDYYFTIMLNIATILLAAHYLRGKAVEEEELLLISPESGDIKTAVSN